MRRPVRHEAGFEADLAQQLSWSARERGWSWVEGLERDIREVEELLSSFPGSGRLTKRHGSEVLRRIPLRPAPFIVWYVYDEADPDGPITLVGLFHRRQRRREIQW